MIFNFDPIKTRNAVADIARLFGQGQTLPGGIDALFDLLSTMDLDQLARFAEKATSQQIDVLCEYYHHAPNRRVLAALTVVLGLRQDKRWGDVGRFMFFLIPTADELDLVRRIWSLVSLRLPRLTDAQWLIRYFESVPEDEPLPLPHEFMIHELKQNRFPLESIQQSFYRTPLFDKLTDFLFAEGGPLLAGLNSHPATEKAQKYLRMGDDLRVRGYLTHYPATLREPEFLEQLYNARGRPDASTSPFYRTLEKPVLWGIRQQLFASRMMRVKTGEAQQAFWMERLHHCLDYIYKGGKIHVYLGPLEIVEDEDSSLARMANNPDHVVARIPHHHNYAQTMAELLSEHIGW